MSLTNHIPHGEFFLIEVAEAQYRRHTGYRLCPELLTGFRRHATLTVTRRNQPKDVMLPILSGPLVGAGRIRKEREIQVHTQKAVFENGLVCVATEIFALHRTVFSTAEDSAVFLFPVAIGYLHQMLFRPVTQ